MIGAGLLAEPAAGAVRVRPSRHRGLLLVALVAVALAWPAYLALIDPDGSTDLLGYARWLGAVWSTVSWPASVVLVAVAVLHHLAAAAAARAAAGRALPWGETVLAQLAASTVNRITPGGLGGDSLNARYFVRRGGLPAAEAVAAVTALVAWGSLADVAAMVLLVAGSTVFAVSGTSVYADSVARALTSWYTSALAWACVGGAALVLAMAVAVVHRYRDHHRVQQLLAVVRTQAHTMRAFAKSPARLAALTASSALTTLVLGAGFAATAVLNGVPVHLFATVIIGYMVAAALGNAVPVPGGIGTTDAALVAVLVTAGMPVTHATGAAVLFRVVTFWLPALLGIPALGRLRARHAI